MLFRSPKEVNDVLIPDSTQAYEEIIVNHRPSLSGNLTVKGNTNPQFTTPSPTPEHNQVIVDTRQSAEQSVAPTSALEIPQAPDDLSQLNKPGWRQNEISSTLSNENVIQGRTRRSAHAATLLRNEGFGNFYSAFGTAVKTIRPRGLHRDSLPPFPKSWKQMLKHPYANDFRRAAEKEYRDLESKGTFLVVSQSDDRVKSSKQKPLPVMWTFLYKFDEDGFLYKFKARLVARGDLQYTEEDTYAATLAAQIFRAMIAIGAAFDLDTRQYDIVNAFANADLPIPIPCECAEGYEILGSVLWLLKALYGLKTSGLLWHRDFTGTLENLGLKLVPDTGCLYVNDWLMLMFYVDDIRVLHSRSNSHRMDEFEAQLMSKYELRLLGEGEYFLGIRIIRNREERKAWLVQDSYIDKLSERFNVTTSRPPKTPLSGELVPFNGTATPQQIYGYQQKVGSLNFAAIITRPDIAKTVSKLSEFLQNPSPEHISAADRTLEYLVGTKYLAIQYDGKQRGQRFFTTSSDSAFADEQSTRNSSYGFCFALFGGAIHYKAVKGTTVITSSTEAELLALSQTAKNFIW